MEDVDGTQHQSTDGLVSAFLRAARPGGPASLDPPETNVGSLPTASHERASAHFWSADLEAGFRHSGWERDRRRVWDAMVQLHDCYDAGENPREASSALFAVKPAIPAARLRRFGSCGQNSWISRSTKIADHLRIQCDRCHDRFCRICARERGSIVRERILLHCADRKTKFLTLTLKHRGEPLADMIDRILRCFRNLRALPLWVKHVQGGVAVLEIKLGKAGTAWHVHLHCLVEGSYVDQHRLSAAWLAVTGDSYIVDIRQVRDAVTGVNYVTKYLQKPLSQDVMISPPHLREAIVALRGRRLVSTFGSWRGIVLNDAAIEETIDDRFKEQWLPLIPLKECIARAAAGDAWCAGIIRTLRRGALSGRPQPPD